LSLLCAAMTATSNLHQASIGAASLPLVMYWGQDSAGNRYPNNLEKPLGDVCSQAGYDIINIAFLIIFF